MLGMRTEECFLVSRFISLSSSACHFRLSHNFMARPRRTDCFQGLILAKHSGILPSQKINRGNLPEKCSWFFSSPVLLFISTHKFIHWNLELNLWGLNNRCLKISMASYVNHKALVLTITLCFISNHNASSPSWSQLVLINTIISASTLELLM